MIRDTISTSLKILPLFALIAAGSLSASAYQIYLQSANSIGYAGADMAALADDASTAWYNPAGMTTLCAPELNFGGTFVTLKTEFNGKGGYSSLTDALVYQDGGILPTLTQSLTTPFRVPRAVGNTNPTIPFFNAVFPYQMGDFRFALGLAIDAPWGLETDYRETFVRSYAERTYIESLQINPSVAIGYGGLSVAAGYGRELFISEFTASFVDFGAYVHLRGWDNTYNVAALYEFSPELQIGATYRPGITHHLSGPSSILFSDGHAHCNFKGPAFLTTGFKWDVTPCWTLLGTFGYSFWSQVKSIDVFTGTPNVNPDFFLVDLVSSLIGSVLPGADITITNLVDLNTSKASVGLRGRDTVMVALGSKYVVDDMWTLKCGFSYDQSPTRTSTRELRLPDNDRYTLAVGARCDFNSYVRADVGLQYLYLPKSGLRNNPILAVPTAGSPEAVIEIPGTIPVDLVIPLNDLFNVPLSEQGFNGTITSSGYLFSIQISLIFP